MLVLLLCLFFCFFFFFQAEDGIRDADVTGVQTCALPILVRIAWALRNLRNRPPPVQPPTLGMLGRAGHIALYVGLVLLPVSGISIMVGNGYGLEAFGLQIVPAGPEIPWLATFGGVLHSPVAWLMVMLVIGHIVMALWHGLVRKDGVLQRML